MQRNSPDKLKITLKTKITLDDIQSYFASRVKIGEIKTHSKFYYLINPEPLSVAIL